MSVAAHRHLPARAAAAVRPAGLPNGAAPAARRPASAAGFTLAVRPPALPLQMFTKTGPGQQDQPDQGAGDWRDPRRRPGLLVADVSGAAAAGAGRGAVAARRQCEAASPPLTAAAAGIAAASMASAVAVQQAAACNPSTSGPTAAAAAGAGADVALGRPTVLLQVPLEPGQDLGELLLVVGEEVSGKAAAELRRALAGRRRRVRSRLCPARVACALRLSLSPQAAASPCKHCHFPTSLHLPLLNTAPRVTLNRAAAVTSWAGLGGGAAAPFNNSSAAR